MMNRLKNEDIKNLIIDFVKFGVVGVINTFTSYGIVNLCYYVLKLHLQLSNAIAFIISVLVSFSLNSIFVFKKKFKSKKNLINTLIKTYLSYSFTGLILTAILIHIECNIIGIPLYIASLLNLVITVPINFILNRFWAFKKEKKITDQDLKKISNKHTFAICAYKESSYLEECIKSIVNQDIKTNILITTSTPNESIKKMAEKYNLDYYIRKGKSDIQKDWNFAYNKAKTELVTIAHQDDIYEHNYTKELLSNYDSKILMYNTNYYPYKNGKKVIDSNSKIKGILKFFVRFKFFANIKFFRVMSLAFGNTINCPSVTYNKKKLGKSIFTSNLKFSLDWDTFLKIYRMKGISIYIPKKLINYRIHDGATTKKFIVDDTRKNEDIIMFNKIWPKFITNIIMKFYTKSYDTYE